MSDVQFLLVFSVVPVGAVLIGLAALYFASRDARRDRLHPGE